MSIKNVNLFGYGHWGHRIQETLHSMDVNVNIIDPSFVSLRGRRSAIPNPRYPAIIATPTPTHFNLATKLINEGYDVLIEKPVATNAAEIKSLQSFITNQIVMAGHLFIYNPAIEHITELLVTIGQLKFIHFERTNFGRYQTNVDVLHNIAFHDFSILHHFFKDVTVTYSNGVDLSNNAVADRYLVIGSADNIPFQIDASWLSISRKRTVTFVGTTGQIVWDSDTNTINVGHYSLPPTSLKSYQATIDSKSALELELQHFLDCVSNRTIPRTTLDDALIIEQTINSALTNRN